MRLTRRGLLTGKDIRAEGEIVTVIRLSVPDGQTLYAYELQLKRANSDNACIGLQRQSINMDALIDALGDDPDKWPGKKIRLVPKSWENKLTLRIEEAPGK